MTTDSSFNLQDAGVFGNVTAVKSFSVDGIRLAVMVTGVGEIPLMGMDEGAHQTALNGDRVIIIRNITAAKLTLDDFTFQARPAFQLHLAGARRVT